MQNTSSHANSYPTPPALELQGLGKHFDGFRAVQQLNLTVNRGEILALLGPNGAGKTTTIRMIMGILRPTFGKAMVDGLDCFSDRVETKLRIGYLPDEPVFYDYLRGREILRFVGEMHGLSSREINDRTAPLLDRFALTEAMEEYAVNYSKGMKKKLAIICAMIHEPLLLVLDEPTNGLDPISTRLMHELVRGHAAAGGSVFFSTHLLDQAEKLCHRAVILFKGELAAQGRLEDLRADLAPHGSLEEIFFAVMHDEETCEHSRNLADDRFAREMEG